MAIAFIFFIWLPTLDNWLGFTSNYKYVENRPVDAFPTFTAQNPYTFFQNFKIYYPANFGLRNFLLHTYSHFKYSLLQVSPLPEKMVMGKNKWLFLGNSFEKVFDQHRGLVSFPDDTLNKSIDHLISYQRELNQRGIRLYVTVAPDANTIYPENMPDNLPIVPHGSSFDRFKQLLASRTTIPFIDLRQPLLTGKAKRPVYYHNDTHWNNWGALLATRALVERIHHDVPKEVPMPRDDEFTIEQKGLKMGDLAYITALADYYPQAPFFAVTPAEDKAARQVFELPITPPLTAHFRSNTGSATRLLYFGDSFTPSIAPLLAAYFNESFFIDKSQFKLPLVEACKPNIVILEVVERKLQW